MAISTWASGAWECRHGSAMRSEPASDMVGKIECTFPFSATRTRAKGERSRFAGAVEGEGCAAGLRRPL